MGDLRVGDELEFAGRKRRVRKLMGDLKVGDELEFEGRKRRVRKLWGLIVVLDGVDDRVIAPMDATMVSLFRDADHEDEGSASACRWL